ncbi:MAG TPA: DUF5309 family protein [Gemmatimonadales bacterium]|nr:DUF5309 family protein [Gemmatimonadales bacterium]
MAALTTTRAVAQWTTDTSRIRDVADDMVKLMPDERANSLLFILTASAKRKKPSHDPKKEWFEDDEVSFWGQTSATCTTGDTAIPVADVTLFAAGDLVAVPNAASSASAEEVMLVTAITGSSTGTLTVTRDFGSASANATIGQSAALRILGSACTEDQDTPTQRYLAQTAKATYMQIFRTPVKITHTAASTDKYATDGASSDRKYQLTKALIRHRSEIEAAGLWGRAAVSESGSSSRWASMGLKSIISTNKTSASTTLTQVIFNNFCESIFKYGSSDEKLLIASPKVLSAINYFAQGKLNAYTKDKVYGVSINRYIAPLGEFLLKNNYRMEDGISGANGYADEAYAVDLPSVELYHLNGGEKMIGDSKLFMDVEKDGTTVQTDEYRSQMGWAFRHEKRHGLIYNCSAYA